MAFELKKKQVKDHQPLKFWYCEIQYILKYYNRIWYTTWIYGRNEDIYYINWERISTWYRPTGERPLNEKKRDELNEKIKNDYYWYNKEKVDKKIIDLLKEHYDLLYKKRNKDII